MDQPQQTLARPAPAKLLWSGIVKNWVIERSPSGQVNRHYCDNGRIECYGEYVVIYGSPNLPAEERFIRVILLERIDTLDLKEFAHY